MHENTEIAELIWSHARDMGALVSMRDISVGAPIQLNPPPPDLSWYEEQIENSKRSLAEAEAMSEEEHQKLADEEFWEGTRWYNRNVEDTRKERQKYESRLRLIQNWTPPTPDHQGLKDRIIKSLERRAKSYNTDHIYKPTLQSGKARKDEVIEYHKRSIERVKESAASAMRLWERRRDWLHALNRSVPLPPNLQHPDNLS